MKTSCTIPADKEDDESSNLQEDNKKSPDRVGGGRVVPTRSELSIDPENGAGEEEQADERQSAHTSLVQPIEIQHGHRSRCGQDRDQE